MCKIWENIEPAGPSTTGRRVGKIGGRGENISQHQTSPRIPFPLCVRVFIYIHVSRHRRRREGSITGRCRATYWRQEGEGIACKRACVLFTVRGYSRPLVTATLVNGSPPSPSPSPTPITPSSRRRPSPPGLTPPPLLNDNDPHTRHGRVVDEKEGVWRCCRLAFTRRYEVSRDRSRGKRCFVRLPPHHRRTLSFRKFLRPLSQRRRRHMLYSAI